MHTRYWQESDDRFSYSQSDGNNQLAHRPYVPSRLSHQINSRFVQAITDAHLYVSRVQEKVLSHEDLMRRLPIFTNLTFLRVSWPCDGRDLLSILRIIPNLEDLIFDKVRASSEDELTSYIGENLPQCFQSKIKNCQMNEFPTSATSEKTSPSASYIG
ncbi:hypothetical protein Sjap_003269 [Stephania japonica]|uniref:Uncharacterized protein n=1 Tax=Stephania japonica TaxID=461633 RepID=A0AAP0KQU5_9MAGN